MHKRSYNFHDIVKIRIVSKHYQYVDFFDSEFQDIDRMDDESNEDIDITFLIDLDFPKKYDEEDCYFKSIRFKRLFPVSYLITDICKKNTHVFIKGNYSVFIYPFIMGSFLISEILDTLLYIKFLLKEHIILHSACVANENGGYLFAAFEGTGKTSLALSLVSKGMAFLSDDKTIISEQGKVYAYPRLIRLYTYNIKQSVAISKNVKLRYLMFLKDLIRYPLQIMLNTNIYIATRVHIKKIFPEAKVVKKCHLKKITLIQKGDELQEREYFVKDINDKQALSKIIDFILSSCEKNPALMKNILKKNAAFSEIIAEKEKNIIKSILSKLKSIYVMKAYSNYSQNIDLLIAKLEEPEKN